MAEELLSSPEHYLSLVLMITGAGATAGDDSDHTCRCRCVQCLIGHLTFFSINGESQEVMTFKHCKLVSHYTANSLFFR